MMETHSLKRLQIVLVGGVDADAGNHPGIVVAEDSISVIIPVSEQITEESRVPNRHGIGHGGMELAHGRLDLGSSRRCKSAPGISHVIDNPGNACLEGKA